FTIPLINGIAPKIAYAQEEEKPPKIGVLEALLILAVLWHVYSQQKEKPAKKEVAEKQISVEEKGFQAPAIAPFKVGEEVKVDKVYTIKNSWKITLSSYKLLKGGAVELNFLVENIQDKVAKAELNTSTYLTDKRGRKYHDIHISKGGKRDYIPNFPVEIKVIFSDLKEDIKAFALCLNFSAYILAENKWEGKELFFGPIK
ncbi:hypothetical protein J7M02_03920, partial [Candidatus Aerophobetes bacterium]|nr:hypothetical protein [Candidatus Aerophobetes bacterium]